MNKSELETHAEKICEYTDQIHRDCFVNGYVTGALKREQKIAELEKQVKDLEWQLQEVVKDNDIYQAENKRLEQQIEKMKCCANCNHKKSEVDRCELLMYTMNACICKDKDKWELRR